MSSASSLRTWQHLPFAQPHDFHALSAPTHGKDCKHLGPVLLSFMEQSSVSESGMVHRSRGPVFAVGSVQTDCHKSAPTWQRLHMAAATCRDLLKRVKTWEHGDQFLNGCQRAQTGNQPPGCLTFRNRTWNCGSVNCVLFCGFQGCAQFAFFCGSNRCFQRKESTPPKRNTIPKNRANSQTVFPADQA